MGAAPAEGGCSSRDRFPLWVGVFFFVVGGEGGDGSIETAVTALMPCLIDTLLAQVTSILRAGRKICPGQSDPPI